MDDLHKVLHADGQGRFKDLRKSICILFLPCITLNKTHDHITGTSMIYITRFSILDILHIQVNIKFREESFKT